MEVFASKFQTITFDSERSLLIQTWHNDGSLNDDLYKEQLLKNIHCIETYRPKNYIADVRNFDYTIIPELQEWSVPNFIARAINVGCLKWAVIVNHDIFVATSIEQTIEEKKDSPIVTRYFDSIATAMEWCL